MTIDRHDVTVVGLSDVAEPTTPKYVEAKLTASLTELHETPIATLVGLVTRVAEIEGPVHRDEIVTRIRTAWGLMRAGGRIDAHVERAIEAATSSSQIVREGDFVSLPGGVPLVRDRAEVTSAGLRRIEYLPPSELDQGIIDLVKENFGATEDEVVQALARQLGYRSTSAQLKDAITTRTEALKANGQLKLEDHILAIVM